MQTSSLLLTFRRGASNEGIVEATRLEDLVLSVRGTQDRSDVWVGRLRLRETMLEEAYTGALRRRTEFVMVSGIVPAVIPSHTS